MLKGLRSSKKRLRRSKVKSFIFELYQYKHKVMLKKERFQTMKKVKKDEKEKGESVKP